MYCIWKCQLQLFTNFIYSFPTCKLSWKIRIFWCETYTINVKLWSRQTHTPGHNNLQLSLHIRMLRDAYIHMYTNKCVDNIACGPNHGKLYNNIIKTCQNNIDIWKHQTGWSHFSEITITRNERSTINNYSSCTLGCIKENK